MNRPLRQALLLCGLSLIPTGISASLHRDILLDAAGRLQPGEISLENVSTAPSPVLWVDARPQKDYEQEHVPGALLLNEQGWDTQVVQVLDQWKPGQWVVVYCSSTACKASHQVAAQLRELDVEPVYVLRGGWERWKKEAR